MSAPQLWRPARSVDERIRQRPRRRLHTELHRLRLAAGLTQADVARVHEWSPSKVHRIEKGHVWISRTDLLALLEQYGVADADTVATFLDLARDAPTARPTPPTVTSSVPRSSATWATRHPRRGLARWP